MSAIPKPMFGTSDMQCPWCGKVYRHSDHFECEEGDRECEGCGKMFEVERHMEPSYNTRPLVTCKTCGQTVKIKNDGTLGMHYVRRTQEVCPESKKPHEV